ncbi:MAG: hypothetical protein LBM19_03785 [Holosporales bacterium]|jgi:hypothetical protein|nr:hypothetical protein [Holosporales bacterium]
MSKAEEAEDEGSVSELVDPKKKPAPETEEAERTVPSYAARNNSKIPNFYSSI